MNRPAELTIPPASGADRIAGVDILRGLAVLAVVANHAPHYALGGFRQNPFFFPALLMDYGYLGVSLFVVISGFCIHRRAAREAAATRRWSLNWLAFWKRRFWRLYPPYLAAIALSLAVAGLVPSNASSLPGNVLFDLLAHLLMIHNLTEQYAAGLGNAAFWSLGMEEQLYALYFVLFLLFRRSAYRVALLIAAGMTLVWRSLVPGLPATGVGLGAWGLWPFSYWLHWTLGAIAVDACCGHVQLPRWCRSIGFTAAFAALGMSSNILTIQFLGKTRLDRWLSTQAWADAVPWISGVGELAFALAFFCLLNWCVQPARARAFRNPLAIGLARLGKVSYSVYLVHLPILVLLQAYLPFGHSPREWLARCLVYISFSVAGGAVFYWLVERWFLAGRCPRLPWGRTAVLVPEAAN